MQSIPSPSILWHLTIVFWVLSSSLFCFSQFLYNPFAVFLAAFICPIWDTRLESSHHGNPQLSHSEWEQHRPGARVSFVCHSFNTFGGLWETSLKFFLARDCSYHFPVQKPSFLLFPQTRKNLPQFTCDTFLNWMWRDQVPHTRGQRVYLLTKGGRNPIVQSHTSTAAKVYSVGNFQSKRKC